MKIPANTTATVYIPATTAEDLKIDGNAYIPGTTDAEGVSYSGSENQCLIFKIKSGSYTFETENISVESKSDTIYNGVDYSSVYNYDYYVTKYPDVKELCGEDKTKALEHFVNNGMEFRRGFTGSGRNLFKAVSIAVNAPKPANARSTIRSMTPRSCSTSLTLWS